MRKWILAIGALAVASGAAYAADRVTLDYKDYDSELMKTLEQTIKYFEPDVGGENLTGIAEDAGILNDGFKYTEQYFTKKGNYPDAVKWSQEGQAYIAAVLKAVGEKNFEAAAVAARGATQSCKNCHEVYKPVQAR